MMNCGPVLTEFPVKMQYVFHILERNDVPEEIDMIARIYWDAEQPSNNLTDLILPAEEILIFQTNTKECESIKQCILQMKVIKSFHMEVLNEADILYNFVVGGDGRIYEGRGWEKNSFKARNSSLTVAILGMYN